MFLNDTMKMTNTQLYQLSYVFMMLNIIQNYIGLTCTQKKKKREEKCFKIILHFTRHVNEKIGKT